MAVAVLAGLTLLVTDGSARPASAARGFEVRGGPDRHELVVVDGELRYRGPLADRAKRPALDALTAATELAPDAVRAATRESLAKLPAGKAIVRPVDAPFTSDAVLVGDYNLDGTDDVMTLTYDPETGVNALVARSGVDGAVLWSTPLDDDVFGIVLATVAGGEGVMLISERYEFRRTIRYGDEYTLALTFDAIDGAGQPAWSTELVSKRTERLVPPKSTIVDAPLFWVLEDVTGDASLDLVMTLENRSTSGLLGRKRDGSSTLAALDGGSGALNRLTTEAAPDDAPTYDSTGDLDGDGKSELIKRAPDGTLTLVDGTGTVRWTAALELNAEWLYPYGAGDTNGDGTRDAMIFALTFVCGEDTCEFEAESVLLSGSDGTVLRRDADAFPAVVPDIDGDGAADLSFARSWADDTSFGVTFSTQKLNGTVLWERTASEPLPADDWNPDIWLYSPGDLQANGHQDITYELGRWRITDPDTWEWEYERLSAAHIDGKTGDQIGTPPTEGWALGVSFDAAGDDYLNYHLPEGGSTIALNTSDGLTNSPIWTTGPIEVGTEPGGWFSFADIDTDGRTETLLISYGYDPSGQDTMRVRLIDGLDGSVAWETAEPIVF